MPRAEHEGRRTDRLSRGYRAFLPPSLQKIERCKRRPNREDWHLIKSQSEISSSNEILKFYLSLVISIDYKKQMSDPKAGERLDMATEVRGRRSPITMRWVTWWPSATPTSGSTSRGGDERQTTGVDHARRGVLLDAGWGGRLACKPAKIRTHPRVGEVALDRCFRREP